MAPLVLVCLVVFLILFVSEIGWRQKWLRGEFARKFVHMTVGSFVAFWPFLLSWNQIRLLSLAFLVVVLLTKRFNIFKAVSVSQRTTYGAIFFAVIVGLLTFLTDNKGIYAAALLQMSLADGLAAVVGTRFGRGNSYKLFGHTKSLAGTTAFLVTSLIILLSYNLFAAAGLSALTLFLYAVTATIIENVATYGLDNLAVPLIIVVLLTV